MSGAVPQDLAVRPGAGAGHSAVDGAGGRASCEGRAGLGAGAVPNCAGGPRTPAAPGPDALRGWNRRARPATGGTTGQVCEGSGTAGAVVGSSIHVKQIRLGNFWCWCICMYITSECFLGGGIWVLFFRREDIKQSRSTWIIFEKYILRAGFWVRLVHLILSQILFSVVGIWALCNVQKHSLAFVWFIFSIPQWNAWVEILKRALELYWWSFSLQVSVLQALAFKCCILWRAVLI